jgi:hypothetical protein
MPLLIGSAALAIDTIQMGLWKRQLQRHADSAALAGAFAVVQKFPARAAVDRDLEINNDVPLSQPPLVENAPATGVYANNPRAVRVALSSQRTLPFIAFFTNTPVSLRAEATATSIFQGQHCMISLEEGTTTGITFTGNTSMNLGCGVASNSKAAAAVTADGSARVVATPISAVGGVPSSSGYVEPTTLLPYGLKQPDPFSLLPRAPSPPTGCRPTLDVQPTRTTNIEPGCYKGMSIQGTVNLAPGTYYIDGSSGVGFDLLSTARITGTGVTIVLTSSTPTNPSTFANVAIHAQSTMNLSSPTSGTFKGVLFYQDPRSPYGDAIMNGTSTSTLEGALYFPSKLMKFNGNSGLQTKCLQMVALRLSFSGNSKVENECPATGGGKAFDATFVRLVV